MPTGYQQGGAVGGQWPVLEQVDGDVADEVVHPVQRLVEGDRECLGRGQPDDQRAHQARAGSDGDRVHLGQVDVGGLTGPAKGWDQRLQVRPAGDLGYHSTEADVLLHRGRDFVGQQSIAPDDAHPGLVTAGLDTEDQRAVAHVHTGAHALVSAQSVASSQPPVVSVIGRSITTASRPGP